MSIVIFLLFGIICTESTEIGVPTTTAIDVTTTVISVDAFTNQTSAEILTAEIDTNDTIFTSEPGTDTENEGTDVTVFTSDVNLTTTFSSETTTGPEETTTSTELIKPTSCSSSSCQNGGTCEEDSTNPSIYSCECAKGFTGARCQVIDECVTSKDGNVCRNGACVYKSGGLSRFCTCFYGMFWDQEKKECAEPKPPCFPNPCHNNGTCEEGEDGFKCICRSGYEGTTCNILNKCGVGDQCESGKCVFNKEEKLKYCECNQTFYWDENTKGCEAVIRPCLPNPCKNGGHCEPVSNEEFNCSCSKNYVGKTCDIADFCLVPAGGEEACKNGKCEVLNGIRKCSCKKGYYLDEVSFDCKEITHPCQTNPCQNDGLCLPLSQNLYNCTCSEGYIGKHCMDLDYCVLDGGNAFCMEASCKNDWNLSTFSCFCENGQYFDYVLRACNEIDFCPLMNCDENEICEEGLCTCKENYKWHNSSGKCEPHFCPSNPCPVDDLICTEGLGIKDYECACTNGYAFDGSHCNSGALCVFPTLNSCEQICEVSEDGYSCSCLENDFELNDDNKTCDYIGNTTCSNKTCDMGTCLRNEDTEICICPRGYIEKEGNCIDWCSANSLPKGYCPGDKCEATNTGFRCKCEGKYVLSRDKITCTARRMCRKSEEGWKTCSTRNSICLEEWSSDVGYRCQCASGFVETEGGICREICSIEENQKTCSMLGAKCDVDDNGNMTCKCPPYFEPFEEGKVCNKPALHSYLWDLPLNPTNYKRVLSTPIRMERQANTDYTVDYSQVKRDVHKAVEKLIPGLLHVNVLNCKEKENYLLCKMEMQFSSVEKDDLKRLNFPEICQISILSSTSCLISPSLVVHRDYIKNFMAVRKTDPCDTDIKDELCESETSCSSSIDDLSFNCTCRSGFEVWNKKYPFGTTDSLIESCKDVDECLLSSPCPQNTVCHNTYGSYECSCNSGYRSDKSSSNEKCVEICNPNPCVHGACTELGKHDFQCRCDAGYRGIFCDLRDENFKRAQTNTIIVGAVLGGVLLVTVILSYVFISRLKKKKYLGDQDRKLYATEMTDRRNVDAGIRNNAYQRE